MTLSQHITQTPRKGQGTNMTESRQKQYYRLKNWTLTLYDEKGVAYLVNPKQVMIKKDTPNATKN